MEERCSKAVRAQVRCTLVACRSWNSLLHVWDPGAAGGLGSPGSSARPSAAATALSLRAPFNSTLCRSYLRMWDSAEHPCSPSFEVLEDRLTRKTLLEGKGQSVRCGAMPASVWTSC